MQVNDNIKIYVIALQSGKYRIGNSGKQINMGKKHWRMQFQMMYRILLGYLQDQLQNRNCE
jgi:hypothetical protein